MVRVEQKPKRLILGKIGKAHGVKGWLKLHSYTEPPENILEYTGFDAGGGQSSQRLKIDNSKRQSSGLTVHFAGFDDPESAGELTGAELSVDSSALPELEAGDFYWHELQDMLVVNQQGKLLGRVRTLLETGANDVLVVSPTGDSIDTNERLIPWLPERVIKNVEKGSNRLIVDWDDSYLT